MKCKNNNKYNHIIKIYFTEIISYITIKVMFKIRYTNKYTRNNLRMTYNFYVISYELYV